MDDTILNREAFEQISAAAAGLAQPVVMELKLPEPNTEFGRRLESVGALVEEAGAAGADFSVARCETDDEGPRLVLRSAGRGEICYRAVPAGPELPPFVAALAALGGKEEDLPAAAGDGPSTLDVYISPECPNCPRSVRAAVMVSAGNPEAIVQVIDATAFPDEAASAGVRSVPMIVTENGLTLVGALDAVELAEKIAAARGGAGDGVVFGSLVDAGRFASAAALLASKIARDAFVDRWRSSALEGRIGLALTADEALADHAGALDEMVSDLLPLLEAESAPLRGDTADLLGKIGHPGARIALEALLDDEDEDVAEIAADALEELRTEGGAK